MLQSTWDQVVSVNTSKNIILTHVYNIMLVLLDYYIVNLVYSSICATYRQDVNLRNCRAYSQLHANKDDSIVAYVYIYQYYNNIVKLHLQYIWLPASQSIDTGTNACTHCSLL